MYPNNVYIKNHDEIKSMGGHIDVSLDKYDNAHGLKRDELARAQYNHWRAEMTGATELLNPDEKRLLIENGFMTAE